MQQSHMLVEEKMVMIIHTKAPHLLLYIHYTKEDYNILPTTYTVIHTGHFLYNEGFWRRSGEKNINNYSV